MSTRMLIDARHPEETRVAVIEGSRVEEFDYESASRRQLKGNIYLARVTRVEPSLQAAFVEYGGNRHGFLAFSEIHPDYYQIPVEDRDKLKAEEFETAKVEEILPAPVKEAAAPVEAEADADAEHEDADGEEPIEATVLQENAEEEADAHLEEAAERRRSIRTLKRRYNIQEVIKRRQIILVQVVKEERGNKGAALTTYLSLAGRYCVLMSNSTHGGGISRKISSTADRKRLKSVIGELDVPAGMGLIIRTAGMQRTKAEIKRDYEYMLRLWSGIRELTLKSVAPALIYEEGDLIKRTIRDLYTREIDEILVEGEKGYRAAKDFMKLLMPSHARKVQHYKDRIPLFHRYQVESQLETMYQPVVTLKSGGYIVINPTEALISIDVNSGRATKEHNIEETALHTNLEAADEIARQLRLRDLAGLIVIDFIDMEERGNNRNVERRMKEALKADRARIQVGRISSFGLMEMSRQRLRPNLQETSMVTCSTCKGTGLVLSVEFAALNALRQLEEEGIRARSTVVRIATSPDVAIYILNKKRDALVELEAQYGYQIEVIAKTGFGNSDIELTREAGTPTIRAVEPATVITQENIAEFDAEDEEDDIEDIEEEEVRTNAREERGDADPRRKRRRRRRRGRGGEAERGDEQRTARRDEDGEEAAADEAGEGADEDNGEGEARADGESRSRRRRGRRGGRRRRGRGEEGQRDDVAAEDAGVATEARSEAADAEAADADAGEEAAADGNIPAPKPRRRRRVKRAEGAEGEAAVETAEAPAEEVKAEAEEAPAKKPRARRKTKAQLAAEAEAAAAETAVEAPAEEAKVEAEEAPAKKPRARRTTKAKPKAEEAAPEAAPEATEAPAEEAPAEPKKKAAPRKRKAPAKTAAAEAPAAAVKAEKSAAEPAAEPATAAPAAHPALQVTTVEAGADGDQPKRKGWWQRTFG
ncbi:Rne/Rng family ribonuclease [Gimibacter soli]|uniref:Ribonuclease E n=1 Tax=Gimibacter soli TaxID=3024400 RepID=A0AAF0BJ70_9PROT|nr:ribonuclease E/G [Gimibacter soli]WCL52769.1 ribonuclease E/G [Gimibacter soli]